MMRNKVSLREVYHNGARGRRGGLMVRVLDSGSSGLGLWDFVLCSWARHFALSTQVYK